MIDISALQIDSNYLSRDFIDTYIETLTWVGGLIWVLIFLPIYYLVQCHSIRVFKKMYPDEQVVYVVSSGIISTTLISYMLGAAFFGDIVPFIIFKNIYSINNVTINTFWIWTIIHFIVGWWLLVILSMTCILSDKRIKAMVMFFNISEQQKAKNNILYKDIASVECFYFYMVYQRLLITFKDNREPFDIPCMTGLKQAKEIILNFINIERT